MSDYKIDESSLAEFGDVVSYEVLSKLKSSIDFMSAFCPVGAIAPILVGLPGVPTPDSNIWQECNGSEITNPASPLRSQSTKNYTPNLKDKYLRIPVIFGQVGTSGGVNSTLMFKHNHGGRTNMVSVGGAIRSGYNKRHARKHSHAVNYSFTSPVNVEPPFYTVKFYMRIQ